MGGSLNEQEIKDAVPTMDIFIETGTYMGDSSRLASRFFKKVYTYEINEVLYNLAKESVEIFYIGNIESHLGDSVVLLQDTLISDTRPAFIFLDAHQSGPNTSNNGELVPLLKELAVINNYYGKKPGIICVNDFRLWSKHWDWAQITQESVLASLSNHVVTKYYVKNDRFYMIINV